MTSLSAHASNGTAHKVTLWWACQAPTGKQTSWAVHFWMSRKSFHGLLWPCTLAQQTLETQVTLSVHLLILFSGQIQPNLHHYMVFKWKSKHWSFPPPISLNCRRWLSHSPKSSLGTPCSGAIVVLDLWVWAAQQHSAQKGTGQVEMLMSFPAHIYPHANTLRSYFMRIVLKTSVWVWSRIREMQHSQNLF